MDGRAGRGAPQLRDEAMLKVFAGADPGPLLDERIAWHQAKLEELEGYLSEVRGSEGPRGGERALIAGVGFHRKMVEMMSDLREAA